MKIPNKQVLPEIAISHSSNIEFKDFINFYKKCTANIFCYFLLFLFDKYTAIFFLINNTTLSLDNPLCFTRNVLERISYRQKKCYLSIKRKCDCNKRSQNFLL